MDPREALPAARRLIRHDAAEADLRMAASRLYWGVFHHAVEVLTARGFLPLHRLTRDHQTVIAMLRGRYGYRLAGDLLDALRLLRVHADEDLSRPFTITEAQRALTLADLAAARFDALRL